MVTPYINCPIDIEVVLPSNKASLSLGFRFPEPQTNMKIVSVSHPRNHNFSVGRTIVNFIAEDIEGQRRSCSVSVDVLGETLMN